MPSSEPMLRPKSRALSHTRHHAPRLAPIPGSPAGSPSCSRPISVARHHPCWRKRANGWCYRAEESSLSDRDSQSSNSSDNSCVDDVLERLPDNYFALTNPLERASHASLYLRMMQHRSSCELSWRPLSKGAGVELHLVFIDQPGSLSAITASLASHGINILRATAFSTNDGVAVDTLDCTHFDSDAASTLVLRMRLNSDDSNLLSLESPVGSSLVKTPNSSLHGTDAWKRQWRYKPPRQSARGTAAAGDAFQDLLRNLHLGPGP